MRAPNVVHRGRANHARGETRLTAVLTLMGTSGLVPNGIPLAIHPEDAGRWWLEAGELHDRRGSAAADAGSPRAEDHRLISELPKD